MVSAFCSGLVWCLVGCQLETFWSSHQHDWGLTESLFYLKVEHGMSLSKHPVKKRNDFSDLCPLGLFSCLSLVVLLCRSSLTAVKVRMKRKRRNWRTMTRRRTCWVGEHLLGADAPFPFVSHVLPPCAGASHVPFLSFCLGRGSDCSFFAAVERESDGTC